MAVNPSASIRRMRCGALIGKILLLGSSHMEFVDGTSVQIAELMGPRGAEFDGRICPDPLEPNYDSGRAVGKFYWNDGKRPGVHSFARGGRFVAFRHDITSITHLLSTKLVSKDAIVRAISLAELSNVEEEQAVESAARYLGLGNRRKGLREEIQAQRYELGTHAVFNCEQQDLPGALLLTESECIPKNTFPFKKISTAGNIALVDHKDNLAHLLKCYSIIPRYNEISKQIDWSHDEPMRLGDNSENALTSRVISLANLNDLPTQNLATHLIGLGEASPFNPVTDYLKSLVWDNTPRIADLANKMGHSDLAIRRTALRIFFCQACAAADHAQEAQRVNASVRAHFESVIVFVGPQGAGKTKGLRELLPTALRRYFKEGVALDPRNKDSIKLAISSWIVELGELDATFRKADIAQLKAFLSSDTDELRMPYAPNASKFKRRTAFVGTVNDVSFLADRTGNRRFIPLEMASLRDALSDLDVDQLWAEAWSLYVGGEKWWATEEEAANLVAHTEQFRAKTWIEEQVGSMFETAAEIFSKPQRRNATEIFNLLHSSGQGTSRRPNPNEMKEVAQAVVSRMWWKFSGGALRALGFGPDQATRSRVIGSMG
jgi:predicted P-loop ATPase